MDVTREAQTADTVVAFCDGFVIHRIRIARTFAARCIGLLREARLEPEAGLLFVPGGSIHTLGMRFAIDVVFLDERLQVLRVAAEVRPWRFAWAPRRTRFVLELAAGVARRAQLECGRELRMSPIANNS